MTGTPAFLRRSIFKILTGGSSPTPTTKKLCSLALACPFIWPGDAGLQRQAASLGIAPQSEPEQLRPGQSLLVSVRQGSNVATHLYLLSSSAMGGSGAHAVPFVNRANEVLNQMTRLTTLHLPVAATLRPLREAHNLEAWHLYSPNGGENRQLDGASYGLAMLLGLASLWQNRPLPHDLCALATVDLEGHLGAVGELKEKMTTVATCALGVRRIIVAPEQRREAETVARLIEEAHPELRLEVLGEWARVSDLLPHVLPPSPQSEESAPGEEEAVQMARDYYMLALKGSSALLDWSGIREGAARVIQALKKGRPNSEALKQAELAQMIAARHCGVGELIEWPSEVWLGRQPRPLRLELLAHVVQSAADGAADNEREYATRALRQIPARGEEHEADLKLLGAIARALAAVGEYEEAKDVLRRALAGWLAIYQAHQASFALSEYLRVLGCLGEGAMGELAAAEDMLQRVLDDPRTEKTSRAFVLLAAGRAHICMGQPAAGVAYLAGDRDGVKWELTHWHLQLSRLRWLARGQQSSGALEQAQATRRTLAERTTTCTGSKGCHIYQLLSALDEAIVGGADPGPALAELRDAGKASELDRLAPASLSAQEQARRIADCYRY